MTNKIVIMFCLFCFCSTFPLQNKRKKKIFQCTLGERNAYLLLVISKLNTESKISNEHRNLHR